MAGGGNDDTVEATANGDSEPRVVFRGVSELVLDAKGRLAIPARHREGLGAPGNGKLIITVDHGGCLLIYPFVEWTPIESRLMRLSSFDDKMRAVQRLMLGHADEVDIDAAGRILIPPALRKYAGLDKRVVLVGQGRKLELWDDVKWQAQVAQPISFPNGLPAELEGLSL